MNWLELFRPLLVALLGALLAFLGGCADPQKEMIAAVRQIATEWNDKAINETTVRAINLSGSAQGHDPQIVVETEVYAGPCVKVRGSFGVEGVAGQIIGNSRADQGKAGIPPPAVRESAQSEQTLNPFEEE